MKRWRFVALVTVAVAGLIALANPHFQARLSWYYLGDRIYGRNLILTCLSKDPLLKYGGGPWSATFSKPLFADLEVFLSCKAVERFETDLVTASSLFDRNSRTFTDLVQQYTWCVHPSFSKDQIELCGRSTRDSIDWLIENGAPVNPVESCGYLHMTVLEMNEDMFHFLLSRGANPNQLCPPASSTFGDDVAHLIDTNPKTVSELITELSSSYTDEEKATIIAGWGRMLKAIEPSQE